MGGDDDAVRIGIDWGGHKIESIVLGDSGEQLLRSRIITPRGDYQACLSAIKALIAEAEAAIGPARSIGIGIPGSVDPGTGLAKGASSTWLNGRPVETDLVAALGRPVVIANDADCFAVSEAVDGAGAGHRVVFGVILGSGAGGGIAVDGRAHHGPNNSAGEWGHSPLPKPGFAESPGPVCYCGRHGCIERWVSGPSFIRDYRQHADVDLSEPVVVTSIQIMERMRSGERLARLVWDRYVDRVARGLAVVVNTLDPDVFVLGGGMSNIPELALELPGRIAAHTFAPCFYTPIVPARHGDSSGVRGAAWLWQTEKEWR